MNIQITGVEALYPEEKIVSGDAVITKFEFKHSNDSLYNIRAIMNGDSFMTMKDGKYVRLHVDGQLMMSDTMMERNSNYDFVRAANGRVFIAGLGVGLIINAILAKSCVTEIVVIEKSQGVIDLVGPRFIDPRIKIIHGDVLEYVPAKGEKYDTIYFDIWPTISTENLDDMKILHNRWKSRLNRSNADCWMGSWMQDRLRSIKRREKRESARYGWW